MINKLDYIREVDLYKKFEVDELLFVEFKCPYNEGKQAIWWHCNFFAYIVSGESLLKSPAGEYILKAGDCVFARKGSMLSMSHKQEDFCELLVFVPDNFIKAVIQKYKVNLSKDTRAGKIATVTYLAADDVLRIYFQSLLGYFSMPGMPPASLLKLKFEELIVHIASGTNNLPLTNHFGALCASAKPSIPEIMDANFTSNLSLNEFARLCARSLSGFKREFTELYHTSPGKWLMEKRLEYGKYLLETTGLNIEEICFESGFENRSHFIRVFKNRFGLPPGRFSRENQSQIKN